MDSMLCLCSMFNVFIIISDVPMKCMMSRASTAMTTVMEAVTIQCSDTSQNTIAETKYNYKL